MRTLAVALTLALTACTESFPKPLGAAGDASPAPTPTAAPEPEDAGCADAGCEDAASDADADQ